MSWAFVKQYWTIVIIGLLLLPRIPTFAYNLYDVCYSAFGFNLIENFQQSVIFRDAVIYFTISVITIIGIFIRNRFGYLLLFGYPLSALFVQFVHTDSVIIHRGTVIVSIIVSILMVFRPTREYFKMVDPETSSG